MNRYLAVVSLMLLIVFVGGCSEKETKNKLVIWSFTDELKKPIKEFEKKFDCEVELVINPGIDYRTKILPSLHSGRGAPDIFTTEVKFIKEFTNLGFYENLSEPPYNANLLEKDFEPYVFNLGKDDDGNVMALSWQITPGGIFYRRSIANEVFGTDDPIEIGKLFSSMDKMFDTGEVLKEKGYKLFADYTDIRNYDNPNQLPWVDENNRLLMSDDKLKYYQYAKKMRDSGLTAELKDGTPAWYSSMYNSVKNPDTGKNTEVFAYVMASWGMHFSLKVSSPNEPDENGKTKNPTWGDWGLTSGLNPFFNGGTWIGIYRGSKNKELAWEFIKFMTHDKEYLTEYFKETGDMPAYIPVQNVFFDNSSESFLGGQNNYKFFIEEARNIDSKKITMYDNELFTLYNASVADYVEGNKSLDQAVDSFKNGVKSAFPEIKVD